jgi:hypothetical protein
MKRKTTSKLTETERRELEKRLDVWIRSKSKPVTKAEKKARWQQLVFAKIKADAKAT